MINKIKLYKLHDPGRIIIEREVTVKKVIESGKENIDLIYSIRSNENKIIGFINLNISNKFISKGNLTNENGDSYSIIADGKIVSDTSIPNIGKKIDLTSGKQDYFQSIYPKTKHFSVNFKLIGSDQTYTIYTFPHTLKRDNSMKEYGYQLYGRAFFISLFGFALSGLGYLFKKNKIELKAKNIAQKMERKLLEAIENLPYGIAMTDDGATISYSNPKFSEMHQVETVGMQFTDLVPEKDKDALINHAKIVNELGNHEFELDHICGDNTFIGFHKIIAHKDSDNNLVYRILLLEDITEKKKSENQIQQAQKMEAIGSLAGGIAHDFNNILSIILGYSDMLKSDLPPDGATKGKVDQILIAGNRAKDLVDQILAFSRQNKKESTPIQPHLIAKEVLKMLRASIPTTIEIKRNIPECGAIMGDPTQLHQIFMNLCTNAYHAMRKTGGTLSVSLQSIVLSKEDVKAISKSLHPGPHIKIEISDTGHGIDKAVQQKIFDPYFTTKKKGEGTGLGLSVVDGLVKNYDGHISFYSEQGKGTIFNIYLPEIISESEKISNNTILESPKGTEHILIVDDEDIIVQMEKQMLERLGYKVSSFTNSPEAIKAFQNNPIKFSLVITDMTMPEMT